MGISPYIFDATAENFRQLVLKNSERGPVLVNYWSPRAGPCMILMPRLVRLTAEFSGRFLLAMLNTDELGRLAREHSVTSLPTVKVFRHGKVVDTLHGAESENVLRDFIQKHVGGPQDEKLATVIKTYQGGDSDRAITLAVQAVLAEPDKPHIPLNLAKLMIAQGQHAQAGALLQSLPPAMKRHPEIRNLSAHLGLMRASRDAPPRERLEQAITANPNDLEARYRLSAMSLTQDDYETTMQQLLEIVRRDQLFRDQAGPDALLALFDLLGEKDERIKRYQTLLAEAMR